MPVRARRTAALCLAAAAALVGCGPDLDTPEGVTDAFADAMAERDWEGACELLAHDYVHRSTEGNSQYCPVYLERRHPDTSGYAALEVQGEAAPAQEGWTLLVAPAGDPGRTEEVTVVEESGRLALLRPPGRDEADR